MICTAPTLSFSRAACCLVWIPLALAGCVSTVDPKLDGDQLAIELRNRGLDPAEVLHPFELTEEMRAWARETVPLKLGPVARLEKLRDRLLDEDELPLEYVWGYTGTAIEVFEDRRANCLSFTSLFIAMAREVGVPADFLAVEDVETYRKEGDLVVVSDHVAVGYDEGTDVMVLDFSEQGLQDHDKVSRISDLTAIAMFHTNRGAEALQEGDYDESLRWLRTAVVLDPGLAHAWVNLGVALRRNGDVTAAEECYRKALEVDPRISSAYQNLVSLLRLQGRDEEAREFETALRRSPSRNPFTYLVLGDINRRRGRFDEARRLYRKAIAIGCDSAECFAALGQVAVDSGNFRAARKMLKKARKIDGAHPRTVDLAEALRGDGGSGS